MGRGLLLRLRCGNLTFLGSGLLLKEGLEGMEGHEGGLTVTSWPAILRAIAAESPPMPPPTMRIFIVDIGMEI